MHLARLAGLDDQGDAGALVRAHQVVMHAADGEQGADGQAIRADRAVGEHEQADSVSDREVGIPLQAGERRKQALLPRAPTEGGVERPASPAAVFQLRERGELPVGEDRVA